MITQKMKLARKALLVAGDERRGANTALRTNKTAQQPDAPKRFLEHILPGLKTAGLASPRGLSGGSMMTGVDSAFPS